MTDIDLFVDSILMEQFSDADLDRIKHAISLVNDRKKRKLFYELEIGNTVKFNNKTRPQYLIGVKGKIVSKRNTKVVVDIGQRVGRFYGRINTSTALIDKVNE